MTKTGHALLLQRIDQLEKQVVALQARPFYVPPMTAPVVNPWPHYNPQPWPYTSPIVTC